jgi:hypothetical protein
MSALTMMRAVRTMDILGSSERHHWSLGMNFSHRSTYHPKVVIDQVNQSIQKLLEIMGTVILK